MKKHLIVGSGAAGLAALRQIRSISAEDDIKLVSMEASPPYSPTALPYLLSGKIEEAKLWITNKDYFEKIRCDLALGKQVVEVTPEQKKVVYKDGGTEPYDTLLLATGSEPIAPSIKGLEEVGFFGFHTLPDYQELVRRLETGNVVLIYGGGLVAMGLASGLIKRGCKVKMVVRSRVLRRYFDSDAGALIADSFLTHGAELIFGQEIKEVGKKGDGLEAVLADGSSVSGNIFVSCLGTTPRVSFLAGSGIEINTGIVVDDRLKTNKENIYAAGDIAEARDFFTGQKGINAILPSAVEQGKVAGANMAGEEREYEGWISMNVFHFFGNGACSIGLLDGAQGLEVLKEQDKEKRWFKKLSFQNGQLVGVEFVNVDVDPGVMLYLIKNRVEIEDHQGLLLQKPAEVSRWLMVRRERGGDGRL